MKTSIRFITDFCSDAMVGCRDAINRVYRAQKNPIRNEPGFLLNLWLDYSAACKIQTLSVKSSDASS